MSLRGPLSGVALFLVALVVLSTLAGATTGMTATASQAATDDAGVEQVRTPENNTTVQHRNPDEESRDGDLMMVQNWFSGNMGEVLVDCTDGMSVGEYDVCSRLDEEYPDWLSDYVDLADETQSENDDEAGPEFETARDRLRTFSSGVQEFRETYDEYQEATAAGDETRARRLARSLDRQADELNQTAPRLIRSYNRLSNLTNVDLQDDAETIREIDQNVSVIAAEVRAVEFVEPTLTATVRNQRVSFTQPLRVTGRVTDNGTGLADRRIAVTLGDRTLHTTTNATGGYTLTHRPTLTRTNTSSIAARFVPENTSRYQGVAVTRSIRIEQVTPTIRLAVTPDTAGFDDQFQVEAEVRVGETPVTDVPVLTTLQGYRLETARTTTAGTASLTHRLPAGVTPGTRTVTATLPFENRALATVNATAPLRVTSTPTTLSVSATQNDSTDLQVTGRLTTENGTGVPDQQISIVLGDTVLARQTTTDTGQFTVTRAVANQLDAAPNETVQLNVSAEFDGTGTNLQGTSASDTVAFTMPASTDEQEPGGFIPQFRQGLTNLFDDLTAQPPWLWVVGVLVVLAGLAALVGYRVRGVPDWLTAIAARLSGDEPQPTVESGQEKAASGEHDTTSDQAVEPTSPEPPGPLDAARSQFEAGSNDAAVKTAYAATRTALRDHLDHASTMTHWEFLHACRENGITDDVLDNLEELTEAYEGAAFAPRSVSEPQVTGAISAAEHVIETAGTTARRSP